MNGNGWRKVVVTIAFLTLAGVLSAIWVSAASANAKAEIARGDASRAVVEGESLRRETLAEMRSIRREMKLLREEVQAWRE